MYKAGYKTLKDIVNADPVRLVSSIDHLPRRVAYEIVAAAKVTKTRLTLIKIFIIQETIKSICLILQLLLLQKAETLQEEAENIKAELVEKNMDITFTDFDELSYFQ